MECRVKTDRQTTVAAAAVVSDNGNQGRFCRFSNQRTNRKCQFHIHHSLILNPNPTKHIHDMSVNQGWRTPSPDQQAPSRPRSLGIPPSSFHPSTTASYSAFHLKLLDSIKKRTDRKQLQDLVKESHEEVRKLEEKVGSRHVGGILAHFVHSLTSFYMPLIYPLTYLFSSQLLRNRT